MAKCKILLSGATGFIGQRLAAHLLAAGYHISALYRNERSNLAPGISWVRVRDLATDAPDPDIGRGIDIFIHLAATVRPSSGDPSGQESQTAAIARNVSRFVADAAYLVSWCSVQSRLVSPSTIRLARAATALKNSLPTGFSSTIPERGVRSSSFAPQRSTGRVCKTALPH